MLQLIYKLLIGNDNMRIIKKIVSFFIVSFLSLSFIGAMISEDNVEEAISPKTEIETNVSNYLNSKIDDSDKIIDNTINISISDIETTGQPYNEVEQLFKDKGFTNVKVLPKEVDDLKSFDEGSVINVSINDSDLNDIIEFDENSKFNTDAEIIVYYSVLKKIEDKTNNVKQTSTNVDTVEINEIEQYDYIEDTQEYSYEESYQEVEHYEVYESYEYNDWLVWIPVHGGTKYHSKSSCSNMKDPIQVTIEEAEAWGFTPCKKCY
ncbi:MAG: hypothetical protein GX368_02625 [Erysipelotrichaceae bacterium]|nr:hypothetical protein [Erysipelotrichaceae bacterium]